MKLGVEKKKHIKSNGPFERNFCVITSSAFSQELLPHWNEKIGGKREIRGKKRARKKAKKVFLQSTLSKTDTFGTGTKCPS